MRFILLPGVPIQMGTLLAVLMSADALAVLLGWSGVARVGWFLWTTSAIWVEQLLVSTPHGALTAIAIHAKHTLVCYVLHCAIWPSTTYQECYGHDDTSLGGRDILLSVGAVVRMTTARQE